MSDVVVEPVASGTLLVGDEPPRKRKRFRVREITPMGFLLLVALIYLFIMVTFVLATLRSQASLLSQGAFGPLSLGVFVLTGVSCAASAMASISPG